MSAAASRMKLRFLALGLGALALALAGLLMLGGQKTPGVAGFKSLNVKESAAVTRVQNFEDWRLECRGEPEHCYAIQAHVRDDNKQQALKIVVSMVKDKNGAAVPMLRVIAPLNVHLPSGLAINVDEKKMIKMPFEFCGPAGCRVEFGAGGEFLEDMRSGQAMRVVYKDAAAKETAVAVSLKGFSGALAALPAP